MNSSSGEQTLNATPLKVANIAERINAFPWKDFLRKTALLIVGVAVNNPIALTLIGLLNRITGRRIATIFLCYPAHEKYTQKYGFDWVKPIVLHSPMIVGGYLQGNKLGLILITSSTEKFFKNNTTYLSQMKAKLERIKKTIGAKDVHMAGVLPTEMKKMNLIEDDYFEERCETVAKVVTNAEEEVRNVEDLDHQSPVLLLGGAGSVGSKLQNKFEKQGRQVFTIDRGQSFPTALKGKRAVLIDVSRKGVLERHMDSLWSELVLLNETFPEPNKKTLRSLNRKGIATYHVTGVKATAVPPFPHAYRGGIPCCAADANESTRALIRRLV